MKNTLTARGHATKWRVWGPRNQTTQVHARVLQRTPWRASGGFIKPLWDLTSSSRMVIITTPNIPRLLSNEVTGGVFSFLLTRAFVCLITKITNYLLWKQIAKKRNETIQKFVESKEKVPFTSSCIPSPQILFLTLPRVEHVPLIKICKTYTEYKCKDQKTRSQSYYISTAPRASLHRNTGKGLLFWK